MPIAKPFHFICITIQLIENLQSAETLKYLAIIITVKGLNPGESMLWFE